MKLVICAGPATTGKTSMLRHMARRLTAAGRRLAFLKIDVQFADEEELFAGEFGIPARTVYSGELCPDHCSVLVLGDALKWAESAAADVLLVETAGLVEGTGLVESRGVGRPGHRSSRRRDSGL